MVRRYSKAFLKALKTTLGIEGVYSIKPKDPGGETFMGISRIFWPTWSGWAIVDGWDKKSPPPDLSPEITEFYHVNFWCRFQGDKVADVSEKVAMEIFDTGVNVDTPDAVEFLQRALNRQNNFGQRFPDLLDDGKLGNETFKWFKWYMESEGIHRSDNEEILLNCMNGEQYIHYTKNPLHEAFRGIFKRV